MRTIRFIALVLLLSVVGNQVIAQPPSCAQLGEDIWVTNDPEGWEVPSLVWTGTEYGLAWHDDRDGNTEIYFARLDALGNKIGVDVRVTNDLSESEAPSLVWTGSEYGVAWHDLRDENAEIYFARLDVLGNKIGVDTRVTNDSAFTGRPFLVWTGSEYGVAWRDTRDPHSEIYFARLDASGIKIGIDTRVTSDPSRSGDPSLVWTGSEYGIAWQDNRDGFDVVYFTRLSALGNEIGDDVRLVYDGTDSGHPSIVWTGDEYGVSWRSYHDGNWEIYLTRLDASGNEIDNYVRVTNAPNHTGLHSIAWTGSEYAFAFEDYRDGNWNIYFTRLDSSGNKIGDDTKLTNTPEDSGQPSMAWGEFQFGVVWHDNRNGDAEIYFMRVACTCAELADHSVYGRLLFQRRCTQDASTLIDNVYENRTSGVNKGPSDAFYLSSDGMGLAPLVVDDAVECNGQGSGLGPYNHQPGVPPYLFDAPIEANLVPLPAHDITGLIDPGSSQVLFELLDTDRLVYGNTPVYLVRDCGIHLGKEPGVTLHWHSHDVEVGGIQSDLDVVTGRLSQLRADRDFSRACFLGSYLDTSQVVDRRLGPFSGDAYYYLVSGTCAAPIGYGNSSAGPRGNLGTAPACP